MNPLEKALQRKKDKTCLSCQDRVVVNNVSYCNVSGKLLHPMLLVAEYHTKCPIATKEE